MYNFIKWYFIVSRLVVLFFGITLVVSYYKNKKKHLRTRFILESIGVVIGSSIMLEAMIIGKATMLFGMFLYQVSEDFTNGISNCISKSEADRENKYTNFKMVMHSFNVINSTLIREKIELEELRKIPQSGLNGVRAKSIEKDLVFINEKIKTNYENMRRLVKDEGFGIKDLLYCSERYNEEINKNNTTKEE